MPYRAYDRDLAAMVARAHADGAKRVFLLGASYGGAVSLTYAPRLQVDGVISLSGETYLPSTHANPLLSAPRLHVPLLIVGTRHDRYLPVKDALASAAAGGDEGQAHRSLPGRLARLGHRRDRPLRGLGADADRGLDPRSRLTTLRRRRFGGKNIAGMTGLDALGVECAAQKSLYARACDASLEGARARGSRGRRRLRVFDVGRRDG